MARAASTGRRWHGRAHGRGTATSSGTAPTATACSSGGTSGRGRWEVCVVRLIDRTGPSSHRIGVSGTLAGMSETAQVALAVVCFSVALLAQVTGLAMLVADARRTGSALRRWRDSGMAGREQEAPVRLAELTSLLDSLSGNRFDRAAAVVLLLVGVVASAVGGLLAL